MARKSFRHTGVLAVLAVLALVLSAASASANEAEEGIVAAGSGEVHVRPDSVRIRVGVEARAKTVEEVQRQANEIMRRALASLRALDIPRLQMQTSFLSVDPVYETTPSGVRTATIVGYSASNTVSVAVRRVPFDKIAGHVSAILSAAVQAGANVTGGLELFLDDASSAQAQALENAVKDARARGEVMAKAAGIAIKGIALLSEVNASTPMLMMQSRQYAPELGASETPLAAGEIVVSSNVTMRLTLR